MVSSEGEGKRRCWHEHGEAGCCQIHGGRGDKSHTTQVSGCDWCRAYAGLKICLISVTDVVDVSRGTLLVDLGGGILGRFVIKINYLIHQNSGPETVLVTTWTV
jgi:hypothetical protein